MIRKFIFEASSIQELKKKFINGFCVFQVYHGSIVNKKNSRNWTSGLVTIRTVIIMFVEN